jgi:hypothetical protein
MELELKSISSLERKFPFQVPKPSTTSLFSGWWTEQNYDTRNQNSTQFYVSHLTNSHSRFHISLRRVELRKKKETYTNEERNYVNLQIDKRPDTPSAEARGVMDSTALIRQVHSPSSLREVVRETGVCDDDNDDDDDYGDDVVRVIPRKCDSR